MSENENKVDMYKVWCEDLKNDLEKMEKEYNEVIEKFNKYIDGYSLGVEYGKFSEINQTLGEISVLIYVGRQMFYNFSVDMVEYKKKFAEQVFKILNISADIIHKIYNREWPLDTLYFYAEYRNLRKLVYEMLDKRLSH
jgi:hypothetical protein